MTLLIAGSLALLPASAAALLWGWAYVNTWLVWASIAASCASLVLLALAYSRSKADLAAAARRPVPRARSGRRPARTGR